MPDLSKFGRDGNYLVYYDQSTNRYAFYNVSSWGTNRKPDAVIDSFVNYMATPYTAPAPNSNWQTNISTRSWIGKVNHGGMCYGEGYLYTSVRNVTGGHPYRSYLIKLRSDFVDLIPDPIYPTWATSGQKYGGSLVIAGITQISSDDLWSPTSTNYGQELVTLRYHNGIIYGVNNMQYWFNWWPASLDTTERTIANRALYYYPYGLLYAFNAKTLEKIWEKNLPIDWNGSQCYPGFDTPIGLAISEDINRIFICSEYEKPGILEFDMQGNFIRAHQDEWIPSFYSSELDVYGWSSIVANSTHVFALHNSNDLIVKISKTTSAIADYFMCVDKNKDHTYIPIDDYSGGGYALALDDNYLYFQDSVSRKQIKRFSVNNLQSYQGYMWEPPAYNTYTNMPPALSDYGYWQIWWNPIDAVLVPAPLIEPPSTANSIYQPPDPPPPMDVASVVPREIGWIPFHMLELYFPQGNFYISNSDRPLVWEGNSYSCFPFTVETAKHTVSAIEESTKVSASNIDRAIASLVLNEKVEGRRIVIRKSYWTKTFTHTLPYVYYDGQVDGLTIDETEDKANISFEIKNDYWNWQHAMPRRSYSPDCNWAFKSTTPGCQYVGDAKECNRTYERCLELNNTSRFSGFRHMVWLEDLQIWWGKKRESSEQG